MLVKNRKKNLQALLNNSFNGTNEGIKHKKIIVANVKNKVYICIVVEIVYKV